MNNPTPASPPRSSTTNDDPSATRPLRYRRTTLWMIILYLVLLIVPWVTNMVLMYEASNTKGFKQRGGRSMNNVVNLEGWYAASLVLGKIQTLLAIPIVSGLLAQAAVVYSQRHTTAQKLSVRQLIALADRSWADVPGLWAARHKDVGSRLVWLGGLLILIVSVEPPLQSLLVKEDVVQVATCLDMPLDGCGLREPPVVGYDAEPSDMQYLPSSVAVNRVAAKINSASQWDVQPRLWPERYYGIKDDYSYERNTLAWWFGSFDGPGTGSAFFASSLLNGTSTGVLRQLAMRMNSSSTCENVAKSDYPSTCTGRRPFTSTFSLQALNIQICAPGEYDTTPWTLSRDRQDISEELWIDLSINEDELGPVGVFNGWYGTSNFTLHCTADTTRGYFEIPNVRTGNTPGDLLEEWPNVEEMDRDWNDILGWNYDYSPGADCKIPTASDNCTDKTWLTWPRPVQGFDTWYDVAPGPLMTSTLAMFGNNSWWYAAVNTSSDDTVKQGIQSICQSGNIPFVTLDSLIGSAAISDAVSGCSLITSDSSSLDSSDYSFYLIKLVYGWMALLNDTSLGPEIMTASLFFANEAVLGATADSNPLYTKRIFSSAGMYLFRPSKTVGGLVAVTVLLALQVSALCYVAWYVHSTPVWTDKLDAFAMARIGAEVGRKNLGAIRHAEEKDLVQLKKIDGLIGVVEEEEDHEKGNVEGDVHYGERQPMLHGEARGSEEGGRPTEQVTSTDAGQNREQAVPLPQKDAFGWAADRKSQNTGAQETASLTNRTVATEAPETSVVLGVGAPGLVTRSQAWAKPKKGTK